MQRGFFLGVAKAECLSKWHLISGNECSLWLTAEYLTEFEHQGECYIGKHLSEHAMSYEELVLYEAHIQSLLKRLFNNQIQQPLPLTLIAHVAT